MIILSSKETKRLGEIRKHKQVKTRIGKKPSTLTLHQLVEVKLNKKLYKKNRFN